MMNNVRLFPRVYGLSAANKQINETTTLSYVADKIQELFTGEHNIQPIGTLVLKDIVF